VLPGAGLGGYALAEDIRFVFAEGAGARLRDVEGRDYIDYVGGAGALILGHSHPAVVEAAQAQTARGMHVFGTLNPMAIRLAERLVRDVPCAERIVYATTGSEATAYAMRLARAFKGRDLILKFEGAYHGNHDYALTSTFPTALGNDPHGQNDTAGRPAGTRSTMLVAPYNDAEAVERIVKEHRQELAAVIVEPVQRIIAARPDFLQALRRICDENDVLLIFDEVVTGFRLAYGGAQEYYGVVPDLVAYGKALGGGYPIGAFGGRAEVMEMVNEHRIGRPDYVWMASTLGGNPVSCAAANAALAVFRGAGVYPGLHALGAGFRQSIAQVLARHGLTAQVIGDGPLAQIVFSAEPVRDYRSTFRSDRALGRRLMLALFERGIFLNPMGTKLYLSLAHDESVCAAFCDRLDDALASVVD